MSAVATVPHAMDASAPSADASTSGPSSSTPKERHSLSLDQRRALRRWANSQIVRPSHKACIEWFAAQYGQTISQSTVSHSLSPKYARLDGDPQLSGSRLRFGNWPDVEKLVLMWHHSMVNSGRQPTNEELADKAKNIFQQLPRYKDEQAPEFSPGWIHRFKKRYGLLIRRQRRHGTAPPPQDDIPYLVDTVPRFMSVAPDTSPAAIREAVNRIVGVEPSLATCARVRDEIVRRMGNPPPPPPPPQPNNNQAATAPAPASAGGTPPNNNDDQAHHAAAAAADQGLGGDVYGDEDPEIVLQNALHALQQEEADAEAQAAAEREARDRAERGLPHLGAMSYAQQAAGAALATPVRNGVAAGHQTPVPAAGSSSSSGQSQPPQPTPQPPQSQPQQQQQQQASSRFTPVAGGSSDELHLTPIPANGPISSTDRPQRCPFCVNQRMLRTIKEAVEHMATHVIV